MQHNPTLAELLKRYCPDLVLKKNQLLSQYTTFKIGGRCPMIAFPTSEEEMICCLTESQKLSLPCIPLGNGSNLLVADQGINAFFIHTKEFSKIKSFDNTQITAESGIMLGKLAQFAADHSLTGLEFAHGIPGTLGGALVMNAGAYGSEMKDVVESVTSYSPSKKQIFVRTKEELDFSYRHSLFSGTDECILSATLHLNLGHQEEIREKMKELAGKRREKQPLDYPSCGSTFKRPTGHFAAALIDECGLKGLAVGGAQVSEKHAGFIINQGNATCDDVLSLVHLVQKKVLEEKGVSLELEVKVLN